MDSTIMHGFKTFVALVAGVVATAVAALGCLYFGIVAYFGWKVTCRPYGSWFEGCSTSEDFSLELGFGITVAVLVVGALLTVALIVRMLGRWVSPDTETRPLRWHVIATMVLAAAAFLLLVGSQTIGAGNREPEARDEQNRQAPRYVAASTTTTTTHEPTTTTVAATTTTTFAATTSTTTTTTVVPTAAPHSLVLPDSVKLLSAHSDGIDLLSGSSSVPVLTGVDVSLAWPDYLGGVIFQRVADRPDWEFDNDQDRWIPMWTNSAEASGIEWIPEIGAPAKMLVFGDELSTVSPYRADTTLIDGAATLVYNRVRGVEHPCDDVMSEDECMWRTAHGFANHVVALDLETGQERSLGIRDVYETYSDVFIGGSVAAVTGAEPTELAMVDVTDLAALGTSRHVLETVSDAWMVHTPEHHCEHQPPEWYGKPGVAGLVSPDGATVALVESHPPCSDGEMPSTYAVVIDVGGRVDAPVVELNTRLLDPHAHVVDYDGEHLLVETTGQSIVVDRQGTITALPECECRYRLWSEPKGND